MSKDQFNFRRIAVIVCGNVLEWYDFAIYGYLVLIIADRFFPKGDPVVALMSAFGVFAVGFAGRIGGALLYGLIADTKGRAYALKLSVVLMATATTAIGVLPTYQAVGYLAPLLLIVLRLCQGLSVGGEFTTSLTLIAEQTNASRGLAIGLVGSASGLGFVLGSGVAYLLNVMISKQALDAWGWRIGFLGGAVLGLLAFLLRRELQDLQAGQEDHPQSSLDVLRKLAGQQVRSIILTILGMAVYMAGFYLPLIYIGVALQQENRISAQQSLLLTSCALIGLTFVSPLAGWLTDSVGIRRLLWISTLALGIAAPPLFYFAGEGHIRNTSIALLLLMLFYAPILAVGPVPSAMQFPADVRGTGFSLGFNIAATVFGGMIPIFAQLVCKRFGFGAVGYLLSGAALLSLCALAFTDNESKTAVNQLLEFDEKSNQIKQAKNSAIAG